MTDQSKPSVPLWAWLFAAACAIIPVLTLGGAIPAAIGIGGAASCAAAARDEAKSIRTRLAICTGIVALCWVLFLLFRGGIAFLTR